MRSSVAMCTYNGARFLPEQLRSLLYQERLPSQVVICDDQSEDATAELLEEFKVQAGGRGIQVDLHFNQGNIGFVRNFEKALSLCDGDVIFLCDQDDVWHPQKTAVYMELFEQDPALQVVHSDARLVDADGRTLDHGLFDALAISLKERRQLNGGAAFHVLVRRNVVTGATMAFRGGLSRMAMPVEDGWIHDEWLAMVAAVLNGRFRCLDWKSTDYRQHGNNQVGVRKRSVISRLHQPKRGRVDYVAAVVRRLKGLQRRGNEQGWLDARQSFVLEQAVAHGSIRLSLGSGILRDLRLVLCEIRNGNYWAYSNGWRSVIGDLGKRS